MFHGLIKSSSVNLVIVSFHHILWKLTAPYTVQAVKKLTLSFLNKEFKTLNVVFKYFPYPQLIVTYVFNGGIFVPTKNNAGSLLNQMAGLWSKTAFNIPVVPLTEGK